MRPGRPETLHLQQSFLYLEAESLQECILDVTVRLSRGVAAATVFRRTAQWRNLLKTCVQASGYIDEISYDYDRFPGGFDLDDLPMA